MGCLTVKLIGVKCVGCLDGYRFEVVTTSSISGRWRPCMHLLGLKVWLDQEGRQWTFDREGAQCGNFGPASESLVESSSALQV